METKTAHPNYVRLAAALKAGTIWVEGRDYVGRAADGVVVQVGNVGSEHDTESYLTDNPTPDTW